MQTKIENLKGRQYLLLEDKYSHYIVKKLFGDNYALEQGCRFYNLRTPLHVVGNAAEIAAKIADLGLTYITAKEAPPPSLFSILTYTKKRR